MTLHQENLDYKRYYEFTFGEYVLGYNEPLRINTNAPRSLDCIYLRPTSNMQGGNELLHLQMNSIITCCNCTLISITPSIIK